MVLHQRMRPHTYAHAPPPPQPQTSAGGVSLSIAAGLYPQSSPLALTKKHSGTFANPVTITGVGNVRVTGGVTLPPSTAVPVTQAHYDAYYARHGESPFFLLTQ